MTIVNLYKYEEDDGSIVITPNKRNKTDIPHCYRLIADEGKLMKKGDIETLCIDTIDTIGWIEIDDPNEPTSPE